MHHLAVDRSAQHAGKTVIALEGRLRAQLVEARFGRLLEIESGRARLDLAAHQLQHLADHLARAAHLLDLLRRLQYNRH